MNPQISILLTTLNRGHILSRAIDSVLKQTYLNWELLISDDGSTDHTSDIVKRYLNQDERIRYFVHEQMGISGSRNLAFQKSSGTYLAIIDSDDFYAENHLQAQLDFILKNNADIIYSPVTIVGSEEKAYVPDRHDLNKKIKITQCVVSGTLLIKKTAFEKLNGFRKMPYAEDSDLVERAQKTGLKVLKNDFSTYFYNVETPGSITKSVS